MELKTFFPQDKNGNFMPGTTAYLYQPGTTVLATGLQDANGNPLTNPFTGPAEGPVQLAAPDGDYSLRFSFAGRDYTQRVRFIDSVAGSAQILREDLASAAPGKGVALVSGAASSEALAASNGASLVGFQQSGTGALARTLLDKARERVSLEDFGASPTSTPTQNAAAFIAAIQTGKAIFKPQQAYMFQFDGSPITYTGTVLDIDLGAFKHTFLNFGGIVGNSVQVLRYNGRFTAGNGYCKGLGRFRNLRLVEMDAIEITDVYCDTPATEAQFFALEYSSSAFADNQLTVNVANAVFKNIVTETGTVASGNAIPATIFGNFGSSSTQSEKHVLNIANLYVENFYSVTTDGVTIIDGDSDVFRLFTNPTHLTIDNCVLTNVGKRFIKTQEETEVVVNNLRATQDSRFTTSNFIGLFEGQATAQTSAPTRFTILHGDVDFAVPLVFFNASDLSHEMYVRGLTYRNIIIFSSSQNILFDAEDITGQGLGINATGSSRVSIRNIVDTALRPLAAASMEIDGFTLSPVLQTSTFPMNNAALRNGAFTNVDVNSRVADVREISNVSLTYTTGTTARRPFRLAPSGVIRVDGLTVTSIGPTTQTFESGGGSGTLIVRDYRSTNQTLAFLSTGTWAVFLDNCSDDTVAGAGVVSVTRALYGARLLSAAASLAFGSIPENSSADLTITVTGAVAVGASAFVSPEASLVAGLSWTARVSAANTVTVRVSNNTVGAITPATVNWRAVVLQF